MREWALSRNDPLSLNLVSDARLGATDYANDHIWELSLGGGEPSGLVLQTTFGLRARTCRIFPRFCIGDVAITDPADFRTEPVIRCMYPNFISLDFQPFPNIDVTGEFWVPEPHAICGRYKLRNLDVETARIQVDILGQLSPTEGQRFAPMELQAAWVLAGQTADLVPVLFVTGGPQAGSGSYPSLKQVWEINPGEAQSLVWIMVASTDLETSFDLARKIATRKWEAERTYLDLLNAGQIEIYSGNPDWDTAFMLAQRNAFSLLVGPTNILPYLSFVLSRQPDQGYSRRGDGSDYNHMWNGQPSLEAYYLGGFLPPGAIDLAKGILKNYLAVQNEDGFIDWKPGLAGQQSFILSTPVLATFAWNIYSISADQEFVGDVFPNLLKFFRTWFLPRRDRDGDGIPEWDHLSQAGMEEHRVYSRWHLWAAGVDITTAESPALSAFLYHECECLINMAQLTGHDDFLAELEEIRERLRLAVEIAFDVKHGTYQDVDRDTHFSTQSEPIAEVTGPGTIEINRKFEQPIRLLIHVLSGDQHNRRPRLIIHGISASGQPRLEKISEERFKWFSGRGIFTGERVYQTLEKIEIYEIQPDDQVRIFSAGYDHQDLTALLPLWAGIPDEERAKLIVDQTIRNPNRFWRPAGLPGTMEPTVDPEAMLGQCTNMIWNSLIGEGLVKYGYREIAAELVTHLMTGILLNLKTQNSFRQYYHAETGLGIGEKNTLQGLAPLNLFMETLGVRVLSAQKVILSGFNPFPWPVTVKYRGMTIMRLKDKSTVIFPDGQAVTIDDPTAQIVSLEA